VAEPFRDHAPRHSQIRATSACSDIVAVVEANRRAVDRIVARGAGAQLDELLHEAERDLRRRLLDAHVRGLDQRWTGAQLGASRASVTDAIAQARHALARLLNSNGTALARRGLRDVLTILRVQESRVGGTVRSLALEQAMRFDHVLYGVASSRLRRYESSIARYGTRMISEIERSMQAGVVTRKTVCEMVDTMAAQGGGLFVEHRYLAARIARTELMASYNLGAQTAMEEERDDFPDLARLILAHFDRRTAEDSIFVHGEIRSLDEDFVDGAGRVYRVPPARPNDREIVIPWRRAWSVPSPFRRRSTAAEASS
jgi:hypothetical protein